MLHKKQGDINKATELYEEAHHLGSVEAKAYLGVLYEKQGGITKICF